MKEFDFSTLKVCSGAHFISKLFSLVGHTRNNKRAHTNNAVKQRSVLNFENKRWRATTRFSVWNSTASLKGYTFKYCAERVLGKENIGEHCGCSSINTITYRLFTAIAIEMKCVGQVCVKNNSTAISRIWLQLVLVFVAVLLFRQKVRFSCHVYLSCEAQFLLPLQLKRKL